MLKSKTLSRIIFIFAVVFSTNLFVSAQNRAELAVLAEAEAGFAG